VHGASTAQPQVQATPSLIRTPPLCTGAGAAQPRSKPRRRASTSSLIRAAFVHGASTAQPQVQATPSLIRVAFVYGRQRCSAAGPPHLHVLAHPRRLLVRLVHMRQRCSAAVQATPLRLANPRRLRAPALLSR
jgi:hypothetical protein